MKQIHPQRVFTKHYCGTSVATEAFRRSKLARQSGVNTPAAFVDADASVLHFDFIEGDSGVVLLEKVALSDLLLPLPGLHSIAADSFDCFNPFKRIDARLGSLSLPASLRGDIELLKCVALPSDGHGVVHGDFHPGQLICDKAGNIWLLDFDDMASGPAEADIGNLIAYLATNPVSGGKSLSAAISYWWDRVIAAWTANHQGHRGEWVTFYLQAALIRRALKAKEGGDSRLVQKYLELQSASIQSRFLHSKA